MGDSETTPIETEEPKASVNAIEFIKNISPRDVEKCVFADSLVTVSDSGRELGDFSVSVSRASCNEELCFLLHASSHGVIDEVPCGTSIVAYISERLEILEENQHEYVKLEHKMLDRKVHMVRQDDQLMVNRTISEKEKIVPENMTFLSFDADSVISKSTYRALGWKKQKICEELVNTFGIERTVFSAKDTSSTWHCFFLPEGHLVSRVQLGSPAMMKLLHLPLLLDGVDKKQIPVFEKKPLIWEEDMELYSKFLDRKEELKADYTSHIRQHPELKALMADFLQFLLLRKPSDVFSFARDFFAPFASQSPPGNPCKESPNPTFPEVLDNKP
ncbi:ciliogenesis-associated TTC17-interacting protein isoform X3 [Triplophysa dalaica]|uniref:ciliogenesis-associated TTC17-interacting protein isoform X3 n=1 Tax=Triplophysa dalaica TaxID=1582913 RepID=UPI0024E028FE|nr:ciliogenesis-associated TTC17-interacting protein isoform X3 [Triplophysa dalaica]